MRPGPLELEFTQGDDYDLAATFDVEGGIAGRTYAAQLRRYARSEETLATFDVVVVGNVVTFSLPRTVTATLPEVCLWDCQETGPDGKRRTILAGTVEIQREVTR